MGKKMFQLLKEKINCFVKGVVEKVGKKEGDTKNEEEGEGKRNEKKTSIF